MFSDSHTGADTFKRLHSFARLCIQLTFIKLLALPGLAGFILGMMEGTSYLGLAALNAKTNSQTR